MANKHEVLVSDSLCIGCGLCAKDCVSGVIQLVNGKAVASGKGCIACGHCEAICPQNAVKLTGFAEEPEEYQEQTRLNPSELMKAIKSRRSIRNFTEKAVPEKVLADILEAGRLAPTGGNSQSTGFIVPGTRQAAVEAAAVSLFRKLTGPIKRVLPFELDDSFFFKKAPLVIVLTGNAVNASLAAENMCFMAEAHGLGVLYSGFFTMAANRSKKIRSLLQMTRKEKAVTTLVIGYPAVNYHRTVRREPIKLRKL